jgi:PKD repeat protein
MKRPICAFALLCSVTAVGCVQGSSGTSNPVTPTQSAASPQGPASIQLLANTRADSQLDVFAKVLNAQGGPVSNVLVTFAVDNGTVAPSSATTDATGSAHTIVTSIGKVVVTASAGSLSTTLATVGGVTALNVVLGVSSVTVGTPSSFTAAVSGLTPGATATGFAWVFGDTSTDQTTTGSTKHTYAATGTYAASVTVTDSMGRTASSTASATVTDPPVPPPPPPPPAPSYAVSLTALPTSVVIGASATLTASVTRQNGAPLPTNYAWDCDGDGVTDYMTVVNTQPCTYPLAGTTISKVTVTGGPVIGAASTSITVTTPPLFVMIVPSTSTPSIGAPVNFTATVTSVGPVPALMQWQWDDTNDGVYDVVIPSAANGNVRTTTYGATGSVTIKVLVTDLATGRTATGTRTVTVQ